MTNKSFPMDTFQDADVCIVGAGLTGLSAALELTQAGPELKIMVLDKGPRVYGASSRNAGFTCFGSISEILDDTRHEDPETVIKRVKRRWNGLENLRGLLGDHNIGFRMTGGYEVFTSDMSDEFEKCREEIRFLNEALEETIGPMVFNIADDKIRGTGLSGFDHMIHTRYEGMLDPVKMMETFESLVRSKGIIISEGAEVTRIVSKNDHVKITVAGNETFGAGRCLLATNGFTRGLLAELDVQPARAQVLITEPVDDLRMNGTFHCDKGYIYFRNVGNRILLGGARNTDPGTETTDILDTTPQIQNELETFLGRHLTSGKHVKIENRWSGIMGVGNSKEPIIKKLNGNLYCAVRMGGMGVAIGSLVGKEAAQLIINDIE